MFVLPQSVIISNKLLTERLTNYVYCPCELTPCLWKHGAIPVTFSLTVNDYGDKNVGKEHVTHLLGIL